MPDNFSLSFGTKTYANEVIVFAGDGIGITNATPWKHLTCNLINISKVSLYGV